MSTLKQDLADGKIEDTRGDLLGFEKPITSRLEKKLPGHTKEVLREKAKNERLERKEARKVQACFQIQFQQLKKEGKIK